MKVAITETTGDGGSKTYTMDKTAGEIFDAYDAGIIPVFVVEFDAQQGEMEASGEIPNTLQSCGYMSQNGTTTYTFYFNELGEIAEEIMTSFGNLAFETQSDGQPVYYQASTLEDYPSWTKIAK